MTSPSHPDEDLDALAAQWLVRAMSDEVVDADILELTHWLEASPAHLEAYNRAERVWEEGARLSPLQPSANASLVVNLASRRPGAPPARGAPWAYAVLAAASVIFAAIWVAPRLTPAPVAWESFQTGKGERRDVQLADGSRLQLNTDTRVRVALSKAERRFELDRGEVSLAVTHDAARPLILATGNIVVRDIGTRFDVYNDFGQVRVDVAEGQVAVRTATGSTGDVHIAAGQEVRYDEARGLSTVTSADLDAVLAWQQRRAVYRDVPLQAVVADLNRYVEKPLVVHGTMGQLKVNAVLSLDSEATIVKALEAFLPVRAVYTADGIELRRR